MSDNRSERSRSDVAQSNDGPSSTSESDGAGPAARDPSAPDPSWADSSAADARWADLDGVVESIVARPGADVRRDGESPRFSTVPRSSRRGAASGALEALLDATRELLWVGTPDGVAQIARRLIGDLGGVTVPAATAGPDALPLDVSFGTGEPILPEAPAASVARMLLERYMPTFVLDAQRAIELSNRAARLAEAAGIDPLTGLPNRRALGRFLGRLRADDTVLMIDLDLFKAINDTYGHAEGDAVLRLFGRTMTLTLRASDRAARYGGEEFAVILAGGMGGGPDPFLLRLRAAWAAVRTHPITFSAGIAPAWPNPSRAIEAADRALYRAKQFGRDQWQWAVGEDYS